MALADVWCGVYGSVDVSNRRLGGVQQRGVWWVAFSVHLPIRSPHRIGQLTRQRTRQSAARAMRVCLRFIKIGGGFGCEGLIGRSCFDCY